MSSLANCRCGFDSHRPLHTRTRRLARNRSSGFSKCPGGPIRPYVADGKNSRLAFERETNLISPSIPVAAFEDATLPISAGLGMDLPDAAAKSSNAEEAAIGRRIDVIHFNHRQVGAKASP